jgi:hypothetical protein
MTASFVGSLVVDYPHAPERKGDDPGPGDKRDRPIDKKSRVDGLVDEVAIVGPSVAQVEMREGE